ncbi:hypothetical protein F3Y22_tig00111013pilonHSYRG00060 [Hibiscus syriacus]|uniref:Fibronectin type-III domain-containing protein n=1 Tax=Hibiscus syriacus TaxID=106335 RepID=A0A6A2Z746_HIBSY|nr:hypothetical protein F3Y22_tig00111013pilonHSYRG00060 [Hibiscus syriacus]
MTQALKLANKTIQKSESRKFSSAANSQPSSRKQNRKGEIPVKVLPASEQPPEHGFSNSWICKKSACRAVLSKDGAFCKRCSCCICHLFDDNKDPSLWLVCTSESGDGDYCGCSCHIECVLQREKVGVVVLGQLMQLDGSYFCASCGKVSELHEFVKDMKAKLETEVGPMNGVSAKMARGIISRLSVAGDRQKLCSLAIGKANEWKATMSNTNPKFQDSRPAACRFMFEEVKSSSIIIVLVELSTVSADDIKGYKLWYFESSNETYTKEPICVFPRTKRRILISNLQPCTEYTFCIVSYIKAGGSVELTAVGSGFKVPDLGKILQLVWAQKLGCFEGFCSDDVEKCCAVSKIIEPETRKDGHMASVSRGIDLNVALVPDLNEELTPPFESSRDEENGYTLEQAMEADNDTSSHEIEKKAIARSHRTSDSHTELFRNRAASLNGESHDCDSISTLVNGLPFRICNDSGDLDESFESCVKIIRWLEGEAHINQEFRLKLLTWFSLRSTEQKRRVFNTFIHTLIDDPISLAGQLVGSFSEIMSSKMPRIGLCSKMRQ